MTQLGDRRSTVRLEVVGDLRGSLELVETARVINRSESGMLLAARRPLPVEVVQRIRIREGDRDVLLTTRVRHLRRAVAPDGSPEYLLGVEFVTDNSPAPVR